jgi:hypothetical protein
VSAIAESGTIKAVMLGLSLRSSGVIAAGMATPSQLVADLHAGGYVRPWR